MRTEALTASLSGKATAIVGIASEDSTIFSSAAISTLMRRERRLIPLERMARPFTSIGARVAARTNPGEILLSSTVKDMIAGSRIGCSDRGSHVLKGVAGRWRLFAVNE